MKIVWTQPAVKDLRELHAYIARDSEMYANVFVERIVLAAERLADYPKWGESCLRRMTKALRELLYQKYRLIYRVKKDSIAMLSVIHGARDLEEPGLSPWEVG